ncbi:MAG: polysulfide reductase NrfD [Gammaproteobacteria bacterium]|jgi:formate-dependent nitrite reductase membrane component NrfD|nr:polysulfide reductase NrfD [Gammaproteobacteria bacterium]
MAVNDLPIVGDSFKLGFRLQRYWDTPMASAFFFGELGAGLFFVSLLLESAQGMLAGLLITGLLKTYFHLSHMGVPQRSWRAILRPDRSWISRGLMGIVCFIGFGGLHLLNFWGLIPGLGGLFKLLAGAAALVVMTYQGFAMSHSTAISLWNSGLIPVSSLAYSATAGVMLLLAAVPESARFLVPVALILHLCVAVVLLSLLHGARHGSPGARKSVELLTRTLYAKWFFALVCGAGVLLPVLLLWFAGSVPLAAMIAATGTLAGYYTFRLLIFKAGVFEPIMSFRP